MSYDIKAAVSDEEHWKHLSPPLAPNDYEVSIYKENLIGKPIYLLGQTRQLRPFSDVTVDLNPGADICMNWNDLSDIHVGTIISDGALNFTGMEFIEKVSQLTDRFICRVFLRKFPGMKYATIFPKRDDLGSAVVIPTQDGIVMGIWDF